MSIENENTHLTTRPFKEEESWRITPKWSMEQLLSLNHDEVISMWLSSDAVSLEELQGHFTGFVPNRADPERQAKMHNFLFDENSSRGYWLGKAFKKTGDNEGEGYNLFRFPGGEIRHIGRYTTEVGPSLVDGKPSLLLYYGAFHENAPRFMDEFRKLDDYIYLGVGSPDHHKGNRDLDHFILFGPTDDWVGGAPGERYPGFIKPTA